MNATAAVDLELLPGQVCSRLRFGDLFGRSAPVEIEVGIGKGRFVLDQASRRPGTDFLALEWSLKHMRVAMDRARRRGLRNLRFYRADARHVISELVPDASVTRLHIYCPDPWPKKRHHKRRFFTACMAPHLERILVQGGFLNLSTDDREYFSEIVTVLRLNTGLSRGDDPLIRDGTDEGKTNYEAKYIAYGRVIHRATFVRDPAGQSN